MKQKPNQEKHKERGQSTSSEDRESDTQFDKKKKNTERLERQRERSAQRRANMTMEQKAHERASTKRRVAKYRSNRTQDKVEQDKNAAKEGMRSLREQYTQEDRDARNEFRRQLDNRGSNDPGEETASKWWLIKMHRKSCILRQWMIKKDKYFRHYGINIEDPGPRPLMDDGTPMYCKECERDRGWNTLKVQYDRKRGVYPKLGKIYFDMTRGHPVQIPDDWKLSEEEEVKMWMERVLNTSIEVGDPSKLHPFRSQDAAKCIVRIWRQKVIDGEHAITHPKFENGNPVFCHECDHDKELPSTYAIGDGYGGCPCFDCQWYISQKAQVYSHSLSCSCIECCNVRKTGLGEEVGDERDPGQGKQESHEKDEEEDLAEEDQSSQEDNEDFD